MEINDDGSGGAENPVFEVILVMHGEGGPGGGSGGEAPDRLCKAGQTPGQHGEGTDTQVMLGSGE